MTLKYVVIVAALALTACAKQPNDIAAVEVGENQYMGFSCSKMINTKLKYEQALADLSAEQRDVATGDVLGVLLFGLPLPSMMGADRETQIAVTKGHIQAIEREYAYKGC